MCRHDITVLMQVVRVCDTLCVVLPCSWQTFGVYVSVCVCASPSALLFGCLGARHTATQQAQCSATAVAAVAHVALLSSGLIRRSALCCDTSVASEKQYVGHRIYRCGCVTWERTVSVCVCTVVYRGVLQSTTQHHNVRHTTKYYNLLHNTTKYYKVLHGITKYNKYYKWPRSTTQYYKVWKCTT